MKNPLEKFLDQPNTHQNNTLDPRKYSQEKISTHELLMRKNFNPRNTHEKKSEPTKYPRVFLVGILDSRRQGGMIARDPRDPR